jgi:hypothetical protein
MILLKEKSHSPISMKISFISLFWADLSKKDSTDCAESTSSSVSTAIECSIKSGAQKARAPVVNATHVNPMVENIKLLLK